MKLTPQYIAGFIDGEGYISILKLNRKSARGGIWYQACLKVSQREKDSNVLYMIKEIYGGTMNKRRIYTDNSMPSLTLDIKNKKDLNRMLSELLQFLIVKKKQAELILKFINLPTVKSRNKDSKMNIDKLKKIQLGFYEQALKLNKRGCSCRD